MKKMRVAMIAPPWLAMPLKGYGGIERVIEGLVKELAKLDVHVDIFANGARTLPGFKTYSIYNEEHAESLEKPFYQALPILKGHINYALNIIKKGEYDIIHSHDPDIAPHMLSWATKTGEIPPALHTFHGPPFHTKEMVESGDYENTKQYEELKDMGNLYGVCISETMAAFAPKAIQNHMLPAIHNAIDLNDFMYQDQKKNYFITLARFTPDKGQHIAAKFAVKQKKRLRMAGTVAGISNNRKLLLELSNPLSSFRNHFHFRYYSDKILPYVLRYPRITFSGNLSGARKIKFIAEAKALLFPIQWEEPFGVSVIEALACGTPVVAMNRGAMPEIIEHGVNGFLANNEAEFGEYMQRIDEINPLDCRRSVEEKFSIEVMAKRYLAHYKEVIRRSSRSKK
jgi:glycosyltransferase involved in cell wall biosynthesis